jgi:hypothetical protein
VTAPRIAWKITYQHWSETANRHAHAALREHDEQTTAPLAS